MWHTQQRTQKLGWQISTSSHAMPAMSTTDLRKWQSSKFLWEQSRSADVCVSNPTTYTHRYKGPQ